MEREISENLFPMGFEFNPSGGDLINGYLYPWVTLKLLPWDGVPVKEIYGPLEPWKVFDDVESRCHSRMEEKGAIKYTIYAFTSLSRVSNSKRVSRRAGTGTWGGQTGPKMIQDSKTGQIIGQSKMLAFEHPGSEADLGHWTMHEYSLSDELVRSSGLPNAADFVVCKITKTVKKKKNGDGVWVRPPQIMNHAAVGEGSGYPIDVSVPAVPIASTKRAAEVDHPNEQDGGAAFKRQKTSGAGEGSEVEPNDDEDLSIFEAELERGIMANNDEEFFFSVEDLQNMLARR